MCENHPAAGYDGTPDDWAYLNEHDRPTNDDHRADDASRDRAADQRPRDDYYVDIGTDNDGASVHVIFDDGTSYRVDRGHGASVHVTSYRADGTYHDGCWLHRP